MKKEEVFAKAQEMADKYQKPYTIWLLGIDRWTTEPYQKGDEENFDNFYEKVEPTTNN